MRLVMISDTHGLHNRIEDLPDGDVLVHAGDFMNSGYDVHDILSFNRWLRGHPLQAPRGICRKLRQVFRIRPSTGKSASVRLDACIGDLSPIQLHSFWDRRLLGLILNDQR